MFLFVCMHAGGGKVMWEDCVHTLCPRSKLWIRSTAQWRAPERLETQVETLYSVCQYTSSLSWLKHIKKHTHTQSSLFSLLFTTSHKHSTAIGPSNCFGGDRNTAEQTPVWESKTWRGFRPLSDITKGQHFFLWRVTEWLGVHLIVRETMMKWT